MAQATQKIEAAEADFLPVVTPPQLPAPIAEAATVLNIIERAARDPAVDIDKMERLILMQERILAREAEHTYDNAMSQAQTGMKAVRTDSDNPQTKSKYASYHALDKAIRPVYTSNGFSLSFDTEEGAAPDCIRIACKVAHVGGHRQRHHIDMPADGKGARGGDVMTKTHATGAAITYGKRYLLGMIFNIAIGFDDDGNGAGAPGTAGAGGQFRPERRGAFSMADPTQEAAPEAQQWPVDEDVLAGLKRWASDQKGALSAMTDLEGAKAWNRAQARHLAKLNTAAPGEWESLREVYMATLERVTPDVR